ncbi:MAG: hypothetical protein KJZ80_13940 [Hyphomicrobiaceae bacterium]|nr:hypothetical protein [Hyphomicrobiaceae bacterium]
MAGQSLLVDDSGRFWDSDSSVLRSQLQAFGADTDFVDYLIRNLGFVGIRRRSDAAAAIRFRPQTIAPMAFARLIHWMSEERLSRMLISTYVNGDWQHTLHGRTLAAYHAIAASLRSADRDGNFGHDILSRPTEVSVLPLDSPLRVAVEHWRSIGGEWSRLGGLSELGRIFSDRYVLFELRAGGDFVVRDFGEGLPDCATDWLRLAIGQRVQDQPDRQYGWACALAYEASAMHRRPVLQDVDAYVYWRRARQHRRYKRLLLPFAIDDSSPPTYLLSATAEDTSIDLRSVVG